MWGTVENLASSSSQTRDVPAGGCIYISREGVRPGEVFITFGGPQGHADRLANLRPWGRPMGPACRRVEPVPAIAFRSSALIRVWYPLPYLLATQERPHLSVS